MRPSAPIRCLEIMYPMPVIAVTLSPADVWPGPEIRVLNGLCILTLRTFPVASTVMKAQLKQSRANVYAGCRRGVIDKSATQSAKYRQGGSHDRW